MTWAHAVLSAVVLGLAVPCAASAQYVDPVCYPWQEVEGNGCTTPPVALAIGGAACVIPALGLVAFVMARGRSAGRGD
jgi:hypothetical protein